MSVKSGRARAPSGRASSAAVRQVREWLRSLSFALLLFVVVRTFLFQTFTIISGSMERTLLVGDFLLVNRAAYGATIPGTDLRVPGYSRPEYGDIVVFKGVHEAPPIDVVKRIVGVPGDIISMQNGVLYRNGASQTEPYARPTPDGSRMDGAMDWQRGFVTGTAAEHRYRPTLNNWGPFRVPAGRYFVLGDNRGESLDSRYWGFVAREHMIGRAEFLYFSWRRAEHGTRIGAVRWGRLGDQVR
jgi:signal peptidase I